MSLLGAYKQKLEGIEFTPHTFRGHGWLYSHEPNDKAEEKTLIKAGAFKIAPTEKKKPGTIILRSPKSTASRRKRRGCCGSGGG